MILMLTGCATTTKTKVVEKDYVISDCGLYAAKILFSEYPPELSNYDKIMAEKCYD